MLMGWDSNKGELAKFEGGGGFEQWVGNTHLLY